MVWIPALSVQEQVERVGAYVGIASFFGIALLAVLYFAQARELKRLRDWAGRAPERARELEERVAEDAARRAEVQATAQTVVPATPAVAAGTAAVAAVPEGEATHGDAVPASEPAGAEAAPAAERVDGESLPPAAVPAGAVAAGEGAPGGVVSDETPEPAGAGSNGDAAMPRASTTVAGTAVPPVATAAAATARPGEAPTGRESDAGDSGSASGDVDPSAPAADDDRPGPADDSAAEPPTEVAEPVAARPVSAGPAGPRPATAAALRVGAQPSRVARRPAPVTPAPARPPRRRGGKLIGLGLAGVLAVVAGAFALTTLGDDDPATTPTVIDAGSPTPAPTATATADAATARQDTTVAVLNGTTTDGLAARLVDRLTAAGYQEGPRGNYADQQRASSVVYYRDGAADSARGVASVLEISEVAPIDAQTAAQPIGDAQVVVVAGHDQAP